jgi:hypothetical protein
VYKCCWGLCWKVTKVLYWLNKPFLSNSNLSRYLLNDPRIRHTHKRLHWKLPILLTPVWWNRAGHNRTSEGLYHSCTTTNVAPLLLPIPQPVTVLHLEWLVFMESTPLWKSGVCFPRLTLRFLHVLKSHTPAAATFLSWTHRYTRCVHFLRRELACTTISDDCDKEFMIMQFNQRTDLW